MKINSYKQLDVWKKGIEIVDLVYELTKNFPSDERFGLIAQMQRSAVSIPSNISEGFARQHSNEFKQYCYISLGSCSELETQSIIAGKRKYISNNDNKTLEDMLDHESKMLMNLIKSIKTWNTSSDKR